jgi:predicted peptidase
MSSASCTSYWRTFPRMLVVAIAMLVIVSVRARGDETAGKQVASAAEVVVPADNGERRTAKMRCLLFLPAAYSAEKETSWPLLLFLHAAGERGDDLELVKKHGPPKLLEQEEHQKSWPFITVSPQCPKDLRWNPAELANLIEHVANTQRVDRRRIYVTGLSMGGSGTWSLLAEKPGLFAAAMPICGKGDPALADKIGKTPVWIFVGRKDRQETVEHCGEMDQAIRAAGGDSQVTYYDDLPHNCWTVTYNNPAVWKWLLEHSLAELK